MNILNLIKSRRSVTPKLYNDIEISDDELRLILEAANWAPTHKKTEPWRFRVLKNHSKDSLGKFLAKKYKETATSYSKFKHYDFIEKAKKSAVIILICMQRDPQESIPEWEEIAAVSMSVQNIWLMATNLQIGSYWSSTKLINYINEFTPLDKGETCLGIFYMGKFEKKLIPRTPGPIEKKIRWIY
tara:strand:+ start:1206 stop:1763 length:558 start_codon:yes stop_codon:yes gene_type:complete